MRVSVVTISFNQRTYLDACLRSLLAPKHPALDFVAVDPGSTDGSRELIESFGDAVDTRLFEPDEGPADGLNRGFAKAQGDYFYFLNSDDVLMPGAIGKMLTELEAAGHPDLMLGCGWVIDGQGAPQRVLRPHGMQAGTLLRGQGGMVQQGMVFRRSLFEAVGGFNPQNRTCWDLELLLDMLPRAEIVVQSATRFGGFRLHDDSLSGGAAGEAHTKRYFADLERIGAKMGLPTVLPDQASRAKSLAKALANPGWAVQHLADRLVPGRLDRLWRADQIAAAEHA